MKSLKLFSLLCLIVLAALTSCKKDQETVTPTDPCISKDCGIYGICNQGTCNCDDPYEFDETGKCSRLASLKFIGNYEVNESCSNGTYGSYPAQIIQNSFGADSIVRITEVWQSFPYVTAVVKGDSIFIRRQNPISVPYYIEGKGKYVDGTVTINTKISYELPNEYTEITCTFTYTK